MGKDWNVLVVEDDIDAQDVVTRILKHHQIRTEQAYTAEEALDKLRRRHPIHPYTGVIIDLYLPDADDGWHLLETIKADTRLSSVPCVAITAHHSPEMAVKALEAGFKAYFPKPLEAGKFVRELERLWS